MLVATDVKWRVSRETMPTIYGDSSLDTRTKKEGIVLVIPEEGTF